MTKQERPSNAQLLSAKQKELLILTQKVLYGHEDANVDSLPKEDICVNFNTPNEPHMDVFPLNPGSVVCKYVWRVCDNSNKSGIEYRLNGSGSMSWTNFEEKENGDVQYGVTPINGDLLRYEALINLIKKRGVNLK